METCVAPVDASRDFFMNEQRGGGGGGALPDFIFFLSLLPFQQTSSGIGHRVK